MKYYVFANTIHGNWRRVGLFSAVDNPNLARHKAEQLHADLTKKAKLARIVISNSEKDARNKLDCIETK